MTEEKTKDKSYGNKCGDFGCTPENMQKMFEMMGKFCTGKGDTPNWPDMMKHMMETCCSPEKEDTKEGCTEQ